ncbi:MAG: cyclophilin-like fold protein, partial [Draconibacterium sp.]
ATACSEEGGNDAATVGGAPGNQHKVNSMNITIGDTTLTATLADNSSAKALAEALSKAPITIEIQDYGNMEKVGPLGQTFPRNDERITAEAGDIILYQGNALVIYYAPNTWSFTRLGKIDHLTAQELKKILGDGQLTVSLWLPPNP